MPGLTQGLPPLALLGLRLADAVSDAPPAGDARLVPRAAPIPGPDDEDWARLDWGP